MGNQKFDTIKKSVQLEGNKIQRINNKGHYAHIWLDFAPNPGKGVQFFSISKEEKLPFNFVRAIENGVRRALLRKGQEGNPITDVKCSIDGSYHPSDSQEADYDEVAFQTTVDALRKAGTEGVR